MEATKHEGIERGADEPKTQSRALQVCLATSAREMREAQELRYRIFGEELGARLPTRAFRIDRDRFDARCDHLIVRDLRRNSVIGTYRILDGEIAEKAGGFYSETEFDLGGIRKLRSRTLEVGRACVDPEYRNGTVISLLWSALFRYVLYRRYEFVIGCASVPASDTGSAARICRELLDHHLAPPQYRVRPLRRFEAPSQEGTSRVFIPSLIQAYLRLGAYVCGDPSWDEDFRTADLLLLLPISSINPRYVERLLRAA